MNRRLLLTFVSAALLVTGWTVAFTCEEKSAQSAQTASAKSATCTAEMAAKCTPAQAAACREKAAAKAVTAVNANGGCASHKTTAVTADARGKSCASKATAVTADAHGHACAAAKTSAVTADAGYSCASKSAIRTADHAAACSHAQGASAKGTACKHQGAGMAGASGLDAVLVGGPGCSSSHGAMATGDHGYDCDACGDMANCDSQIRAAGGQTQVVRLKNGVMFIHTATGAAHVRAVQAALTRRSDRLTALTAAGDRARLCPECKTMRGAMASGKLSRETVTIEGGCLTLMTSNDRTVVAKLHSMASTEMARNKS